MARLDDLLNSLIQSVTTGGAGMSTPQLRAFTEDAINTLTDEAVTTIEQRRELMKRLDEIGSALSEGSSSSDWDGYLPWSW